MSGSLNKVLLIGNVGDDPEIKTMENGKRLANFSIATSEKWKDDSGQKQEKTEWHRVVVFSQGLVGIIENYIKKGTKLYLEGSIRTRKWQDKDNQNRYSTEIVLSGFNHQLQILSSRQDFDQQRDSYISSSSSDSANFSRKPASQAPSSAVDNDFIDDTDDEIPF